jgi:hypothetical protein
MDLSFPGMTRERIRMYGSLDPAKKGKCPVSDEHAHVGNTRDLSYRELGDKRIAEVVITNHARQRWTDRVESEKTGYADIVQYLWQCLKEGRIVSYSRSEQNVFTVDDDLVFVAEFANADREADPDGYPLHKMIVVTFLGRMSETIELRDLRTYYSWLRHSRRMTLIKNNRKRR